MIKVGTQNTSELFLGTSKVSEVWLGTQKVYDSNTGTWVLFDDGAVGGIEWQGNALTRTGYYGNNKAEVKTDNLFNYIKTSSNTYQYNGHFVTAQAVSIPAGATTMKCKVYCKDNGYGFNDSNSIQLGLIGKDTTIVNNDTLVTIAQGNCSGLTYAGRENAKTISGNVSAYAGSNAYKAIIYTKQQPNASEQKEIRFIKVWFE